MSICVVHLVRKCNGIDAFRTFVGSYQSKAAGLEHELLIIYKGFSGQADAEVYRDSLSIPHRELFLADEGLDIGPYFVAAGHCDEDYLCFLNSFSSILKDGWLELMFQHIVQPEIGIVSATGSWESHFENHLNSSKTAPKSARRWLPPLASRLMRRYITRRTQRNFLPFPNPHVRTNAFLVSRQLFVSLRHPKIRTKTDALGFESGRNGLTPQILQRGLRPVVVGRDGRAYNREEWPGSRTFRSGSQENLLVADNQTKRYDLAGAAERKMLSQLCWGRDFGQGFGL